MDASSSTRVYPGRPDRRVAHWVWIAVLTSAATAHGAGTGDGPGRFEAEIRPMLVEYCQGCHGNGLKKGGVSLDGFADEADALRDRDLWHNVLKNVRAGIMPPAGEDKPSAEEVKRLDDWIKREVFRADPADPDPGRVTLRRLNRVEYRNTIRDLMGIDYRADEEFPADDSGYGFDNIGDVLTVSPLLLEKYMKAAEAIVAEAVPTVGKAMALRPYPGREFKGEGADGNRMTFYKEADVARTITLERAGSYRVGVDLAVDGFFDPDPGRCRVTFAIDGKERVAEEYAWADDKTFHYGFEEVLAAGEHRLSFHLTPLLKPDQQKQKLDMRMTGANVDGPTEPEHWVRPRRWERFFDRDDPGTPEGRALYMREALRRFATLAYRRPVDERTVERLSAIAGGAIKLPGATVERAIGRAMVAVLASPRFLFRLEGVEPADPGHASPRVDEYALATRLSYFLWSTMPDAELIGLARAGKLRAELPAQVKRLLADDRFGAFVQDFTGQWLQVRDYENFPIQARAILRQDNLPRMTDEQLGRLRRLMKQETESYFAHVVRQDRSLLELIGSDYTFANETLAKHYGIPGVTGNEVRKVTLPPGSPRGGLLTQAGLLMVTSNPSRTSPVKRGAFLLENFLGSPTPPPPPAIPSFEEARKGIKDKKPTTREVMALHRADALCASCHSRMDPLGLALENFNALGMWRDAEGDQPIDASGTLLSGQPFKDIRDLKAILKGDLRRDFYGCMAEKLMTYALGRGVDYRDVETIDQIVDKLDRDGGTFSTLLMGIVDSSAFQRRGEPAGPSPSKTIPDGTKR